MRGDFLIKYKKKVAASDMQLATTWSARRDSNSRSLESESNALATVLRAEIYYCYYSGNANLVRIARIIFYQECRFRHFFCF